MTTKFIYPAGDFISGFGADSGYELECQAMVIRGMEWFEENPNAEPTFKQYSNVYGIIDEENADAKNLVKAIVGKESDATGAMVQASVNHCMYAHKHGWEKYISEITKTKNA